MASINDIKRRKKSITDIKKITKTMELISTNKFQILKNCLDKSNKYVEQLFEVASLLWPEISRINHPYITGNKDKKNKDLVILVTSNSGLAGGYNINLLKTFMSYNFGPKTTKICSIGDIGRKFIKNTNYEFVYPIKYDDYNKEFNYLINFFNIESINKILKSMPKDEDGDINMHYEEDIYNKKNFFNFRITYILRFLLQNLLLKRDKFLSVYNFDNVYILFTKFKNTISHIPTLIKLFPFDFNKICENLLQQDLNKKINSEIKLSDINFDQNKFDDQVENCDIEENLLNFIEQNLCAILHNIFTHSCTCENASRMQIMNSANSNADKIIDELTSLYNKKRQEKITQELSEIVSATSVIL